MKRAVLSTRDRKDGAFGEDEEAAADDGMESGESEREETQPAAPGDLLWLQEDTQTPVQRRRKKKRVQTAAVPPPDLIQSTQL